MRGNNTVILSQLREKEDWKKNLGNQEKYFLL